MSGQPVPGARPRAVVCGTTFGQVYLEAFSRPEMTAELAGIVARGSDRSAACAQHYGVPLYTGLDEVPGDVSLACVVIRGGLLGGHGTDLALDLLGRGVSVLQEHPVHHDELARCLRTARQHGAHYRLNSFYPDLPPVRGFLRAARGLLAEHPARYVEAACGFQVGYALLDIVGSMLGRTKPWELDVTPAGAGPFRTVCGQLGGVPVSLRVQHELDPADPDSGELLLHRVTLGTDAGELTLLSSHGPVVWTGRPQTPAGVRDPAAEPLYQAAELSDDACWTVLGPATAPGQATAYTQLWPTAAAQALSRLAAEARAGASPLRAGQQHLELCRIWQHIAGLLGPPRRVPSASWAPVTGPELSALADNAAARRCWPR